MEFITMELDPSEQAVLDKWGSEDAVYDFLRCELQEINDRCFSSSLTLPTLQLMPMWLSHGLMGEANRGGQYEPADENKPAQIGLFSSVLLDECNAKTVLAHEMIHHWELSSPGELGEPSYPSEVDQLIGKRFPKEVREKSWRAGHSPRFISKACQVAQSLGITIRDLLFG